MSNVVDISTDPQVVVAVTRLGTAAQVTARQLNVPVVAATQTDIEATVQLIGLPGPEGPPGGPTVVAVPYASPWPPASPQPDTLYLRLAP